MKAKETNQLRNPKGPMSESVFWDRCILGDSLVQT